ncbi:hypothetical protein QRQ56_19450 [Bradyrhizobium sp. U531]|uniref:hypothetical protein n=1 Tax=Bradyrhizobium sp. U531 TaxID=3053458 RepID=UPI003F42C5CA
MAKKTQRLSDELSAREFSSTLEKIGRRDRTEKAAFERDVLTLFNSTQNWKAIRLPGGGNTRPGDLLVTRVDLEQERRYIIDCTNEVNPGSIKRAYDGLRYHIDRSPERPPDFDEYWHVGPHMIAVPMRRRPRNDRRFRVLDLRQLKALLAAPKPKREMAVTRIGKAFQANEKEIMLAISGLILQIEEKLETLGGERPNSDDAKAKNAKDIFDLEKMKIELERIRELAAAFTKGKAPEKDVVKSVKTFRDDLHEWWEERHGSLLTTTAKSALFVSSASVLALMGANTPTALSVVGALIGGKVMLKTIKKVGKKVLGAIQ